jgi:large subunit ribosomal protein L4
MSETRTIDIHDAEGGTSGSVELPADLFDVTANIPLIHQVVVAQLAAARQGTASVKTRAEVAGGGAKPYRQKGTGRARQGSIRAPQYTGGGIVHGPQPRDHEMRVNKKMKRGALRSALTDALVSGKLAVVQDLEFDEPKTRSAAEVLDRLELGGRVLLVLPAPSDSGAVERSFRNIRDVRVAYARSLGVYEVIAADRLVLTEGALDVVEGVPANAAEAAPGGRASRAAKAADEPSGAEAGITDEGVDAG